MIDLRRQSDPEVAGRRVHAVGVVARDCSHAKVPSLVPSAALALAHLRAVQALGTADQALTVEALRALWRVELRHALKSGDLTAAPRLRTSDQIMVCTCTDAEEAAGLCVRPLLARAWRAAGVDVALDGMEVKRMRFRAEWIKSAPGGALGEVVACPHRHHTVQAAAECVRRLQDRHEAHVGDRFLVREVDGPDIWQETTIEAPPAYAETLGRVPSGPSWVQRVHAAPVPRRNAPPFQVEVELKHNALDLHLRWPVDAQASYSPRGREINARTAGAVGVVAFLFRMPWERLHALYQDYHRETSDDGSVVHLQVPQHAPAPVATGGADRVRPAGELRLFPGRPHARVELAGLLGDQLCLPLAAPSPSSVHPSGSERSGADHALTSLPPLQVGGCA